MILGEDFDGCGWKCRKKAVHCNETGMCTFGPPPPCEHPLEDICIASDSAGVVCGKCLTELSVRILAEEAEVGLSWSCWCPEDCDCEPRPSAWSLDPRKVLRILDLTDHLADG
jgi:hypothetical protein